MKTTQEQIDKVNADIDQIVKDTMTSEDVLKALSDDVQIKRFMLNCFCEMLSEFANLRKAFDEFLNVLSVCSADKMAEFFKQLKDNIQHEQKVQELKEKMSKSHKKKAKSKKE